MDNVTLLQSFLDSTCSLPMITTRDIIIYVKTLTILGHTMKNQKSLVKTFKI